MTAAAEQLANLSTSIQGGAIKVVDLTQTLTPTTPVIALPPEVGANSPPFSMIPVSNFDEKGPGWAGNEIRMGEHTCTHFDAPNLWHTGRTYPDGGPATIPADQLIAPACVIDCSKESAANPDFLMEVEHIEAWEAKHGKIPAKSWVLMRTDWSKRTDPEAFLNGGHTPGPRSRRPSSWPGATSWASASRRSAPMQAWPGSSTRRSRRTTSCTATTVTAWPAWPTWTSCRPR